DSPIPRVRPFGADSGRAHGISGFHRTSGSATAPFATAAGTEFDPPLYYPQSGIVSEFRRSSDGDECRKDRGAGAHRRSLSKTRGPIYPSIDQRYGQAERSEDGVMVSPQADFSVIMRVA